MFTVVTSKGTAHQAPVIAIAGGLGSFEPRKPRLDNLNFYEGKGVEYIIKDPTIYKNKRIVIAGGGDSASGLEYLLGRYCERSYTCSSKK